MTSKQYFFALLSSWVAMMSAGALIAYLSTGCPK